MTERLYYSDPYLVEFDATVTRVERRDGVLFAVLDRTAFYPTSGGQPSDTGLLDTARVNDVIDQDDGSVAHAVDGLLEAGQSVRGRIDWIRRFDHMQQHTGQHVLSAAFDRLHDARTESFHLGADASTIDLSKDLPADAIRAAEAAANRVVWQDLPVAIKFATAEEAGGMGLRKDPPRRGILRLIEVEGFDLSACGGTHVTRTGAIGIIAVSSWERFKGGTRVEFLCGGRALTAFRQLKEAVAGSVRLLSVLPPQLPSAIERLQAENRDDKRTIKELHARLAGQEAEALARRATRVERISSAGSSQASAGQPKLVVEAVERFDAAGLKSLASAVVAQPGYALALVSAGAPSLIVIARSRDVPGDAAAVLQALTARFGGRGGGKPDLAQGGGLAGPVSEILQVARQLLRDAMATNQGH